MMGVGRSGRYTPASPYTKRREEGSLPGLSPSHSRLCVWLCVRTHGSIFTGSVKLLPNRRQLLWSDRGEAYVADSSHCRTGQHCMDIEWCHHSVKARIHSARALVESCSAWCLRQGFLGQPLTWQTPHSSRRKEGYHQGSLGSGNRYLRRHEKKWIKPRCFKRGLVKHYQTRKRKGVIFLNFLHVLSIRQKINIIIFHLPLYCHPLAWSLKCCKDLVKEHLLKEETQADVEDTRTKVRMNQDSERNPGHLSHPQSFHNKAIWCRKEVPQSMTWAKSKIAVLGKTLLWGRPQHCRKGSGNCDQVRRVLSGM